MLTLQQTLIAIVIYRAEPSKFIKYTVPSQTILVTLLIITNNQVVSLASDNRRSSISWLSTFLSSIQTAVYPLT